MAIMPCAFAAVLHAWTHALAGGTGSPPLGCLGVAISGPEPLQMAGGGQYSQFIFRECEQTILYGGIPNIPIPLTNQDRMQLL